MAFKMRIGSLILILFLTFSCNRPKVNDGDKIRLHYDSLARQLFLSPEINLQSTSNIDSITIDFFDDEDFRLLLDVRQLCQAVSDSFAIQVKISRFNIREFELGIDDEILRYDTGLYPLIDNYVVKRDSKIADSLKQITGMHPATIEEYHAKVEKYFMVLRKEKQFSTEKRNMVISYYVSELTEVPYPQSMYRLFVSDKFEIRDHGSDIDYNTKNVPQDAEIRSKIAYDKKVHLTMPSAL